MDSQQQIHTKENLDKQKNQQQSQKNNMEDDYKPVSFFQMFRFATKQDVILMIIGSLGAAATGTAMPAFAYIWGRMTDSFSDPELMVQMARQQMLTFIYVGIGALFAGLLMFGCWMIAGQRQGITCRKAYLRSLLKQEIGWFDVINQSQLASKFASDTFAFQGAIGEKISTVVMTAAMIIAGFIFSFITGWLMTFVVFATLPALGISGYFYMKVIGEKDQVSKKKYHKAGGRAEQAISSIKTVKQLNGEDYQTNKYKQCLDQASKDSSKYGLLAGLGIASIFFTMIASYALGFWYGSKCIIGADNCPNQNYTAGEVLIVFFAIVIVGFNLSQLTPAFKKIAEGRQAAARIFAVIDRDPLIKNPQNGKKINDLKGIFKFQNVTFSYPKDPSNKILKNLNIQFHSGKNGLVGESGCGKSTVLQLVMRFYDPDEGRITLDGVDLRQIDLIWLRQQFGYVGQQPVLFATSIKDNLLFGKQDATDQQIKKAIHKAQADFVFKLEQGLETYVGYGGGQLSGGQKQRIAIARAILRNPRILLLDEATSALDRRNQKLIQRTLDEMCDGRTTLTVAHRVSTIMDSDMIFVFEKGGIAENGKFKDLKRFSDHKYEEQQEQQYKKKEEQQLKQISALEKKKSSGISPQEKKPEQKDPFKTKEDQQKQRLFHLSQKYNKQINKRLFAYSYPKMKYFVVGSIMALINGCIFPVFSIFLAHLLEALIDIQIDNNDQQALDNIDLYSLIFFLLAIAALVITTIQIWFFNIVGQAITKAIRVETYQKILKMPVPWFDIPQNNAGTLTARLSVDAEQVNSLTTTIIYIKIQNLSTLLAGIIIALIFQWRTALVAIGLLPFMIISGVIQMQFQTGFSDKTDAAYKDSSNLIMEAMINIRTVTSFGYQGVVANRYDKKMQKPYKLAIKKGILSGFFFGLSQFIMFTIFGLLFYIGAIFVRDNEQVDIGDMFTALYAILFAGMTAGNNAHFLPDEAAAKNSAANLFQIQDGEDQEQIQEKQKSAKVKQSLEGTIELKDVDFKYDSRSQYVFKNMNLKIKVGQKAAFVGTSGCGKSTIIQLLQRFYYPQKGSITINGVQLKDYDIHYLRSQFGVVSQEPVLFNGSFKDNIVYNLQNISEDQVHDAANRANAISFILGNQKVLNAENSSQTGFDRSVGVKGSHISGGQKQRVAIARALLRKPHILLLDEATSALDSENEKKVQDSLDSNMKGKTTISIAHRISTIKNSDIIYVFQKGKIVEEGNYQELVNKKGYFYNLERGIAFV